PAAAEIERHAVHGIGMRPPAEPRQRLDEQQRPPPRRQPAARRAPRPPPARPPSPCVVPPRSPPPPRPRSPRPAAPTPALSSRQPETTMRCFATIGKASRDQSPGRIDPACAPKVPPAVPFLLLQILAPQGTDRA